MQLTDFHIAVIGVIAGTCTTASFIPQIFKILKTGSARDISLGMYVVFTAGISLWLIYGILIKEFPVILANSVGIVFASAIITMKLRYDRRDRA